MSAFDPKRTSGPAQHTLLLRRNLLGFEPTGVVPEPGDGSRASARFHQVYSWFSSRLAAAVARTASHERLPHRLYGRGLARGVRARDRGPAKGLAPTRLPRSIPGTNSTLVRYRPPSRPPAALARSPWPCGPRFFTVSF